MISIADSKKVWASNIFFLNDSSEILYASSLMLEVLSDYSASDFSESEKEMKNQFNNWIVNWLTKTQYNIFIFSLSEEKNLLSQWRSYTPHGKGLSIGFDHDTINSMLSESSCRIAKCLYAESEQKSVLSDLINKIFYSFRNEDLTQYDLLGNKDKPDKFNPFFNKFVSEILQVLAIIKHPSFQEEKEWRIISRYYAQYTVDDIKYREGSSILVPYIEINFPDIGRPPIKEVFLGPTEYNNLSMSSLGQFLASKKICNHVISSHTPYRVWK